MYKLFNYRICVGALALLLLSLPTMSVGANTLNITSSSYPGYLLVAITNHPIDFSRENYYRDASFSQSSDSGVTLGVTNRAGDWCTGGPTNWPRATDGPHYINNPPDSSVYAMTDWIAYGSCTTGHNYLIQGYHEEYLGGTLILSGYTTEQ